MLIIFIIALLIIGIFLTVFNFWAFYNLFSKEKNISWIPLLGGIFLSLGIYLLNMKYSNFWWIAFFIDLGSIWGFLYNFILYKWINKWYEKK